MAAKLEYTTANELDGIGPGSGQYTPGFYLKNTSSEAFTIADPGFFPIAKIDYGTLPFQSTLFEFNRGNKLNGITLNPGESIGTGSSVGTYVYPAPTYLDGVPLFEFTGNFVEGSGTAYVTFGFGPENSDPSLVEHVTVPFTFTVDKDDTFPTLTKVNTFSSVSPPITVTPEPVSSSLFLLGAAGLGFRRKYSKASSKRR